MKLHRLTINNIRGIRQFEHDFQGNNAIIYGANGTGKSSVLDAIDFLLTGRMSKLQGEGTSGISLQRHGCHVDFIGQPEKCIVSAVVGLPGCDRRVTITRRISEPENLFVAEGTSSQLDAALTLAKQGHHILTRREMLRFIAVTPNDRGKQIQALLSLENIDKVRRNLGSVQNTLRQDRESAVAERERSESRVASFLNLNSCNRSAMQIAVNESRVLLGAEPLSGDFATNIMDGISPIRREDTPAFSPTLLTEQAMRVLQFCNESNRKARVEQERDLRHQLQSARSNPDLYRLLSQQRLLEIGIEIADDDACPLCDTPWSNSDLRAHLEQKISQAEDASQLLSRIDSLQDDLRRSIMDVMVNVDNILMASQLIEEPSQVSLRDWMSDLNILVEALRESLKDYPVNGFTQDRVFELFSPPEMKSLIKELLSKLESLEAAGKHGERPEDVAYKRLVQVQSGLNELLEVQRRCELAELAYIRSKSLNESFLQTRDQVLHDIYNAISKDFSRTYIKLNPDEKFFDATLQPTRAGLRLSVPFYDRGEHPPNALHSDGHQDSMGICMFLALADRLASTNLQTLVLDDLVTTVDIGHRKRLAELLASASKDTQAIVTTSDQVWQEQLRNARFAPKLNQLRLLNWSIVSGPQADLLVDEWDAIDLDLREGAVNAAAFRLRRWAESFFRELCDRFGASVIFRADLRWTLEDFRTPAQTAIKSSLKKAKSVAQLSNPEQFAAIDALDKARKSVQQVVADEVWAVNPSVHYNPWENLSPEEFRDVVNAFKAFSELLLCKECGAMLRPSDDKKFIECDCRATNWRLS